MKIIHISDLHIHGNNDDNKNVIELLKFILENYPQHILIVTGDITDDGEENQYLNAFDLLEPFLGRIFIAPGNHDYGVIGSFFDKERADRFDYFLSKDLKQGGTFSGRSKPVVNKVENVVFIALDSNLETETPFDFASGEIGSSQLLLLNTILKMSEIKEMKKILFFHHHPCIVNDPFMELKDAKELVKVIYGRVDGVLFGHKHEMKMWKNRWKIPYVIASDNSPGKEFANQLTIEPGVFDLKSIPIK